MTNMVQSNDPVRIINHDVDFHGKNPQSELLKKLSISGCAVIHNRFWYEPKVREDSVVVFNSEMLEIGTRGFLNAVVHRVKTNSNSYSESR